MKILYRPLLVIFILFGSPVFGQSNQELLSAVQNAETAEAAPHISRDDLPLDPAIGVAILAPDGSNIAFTVNIGKQAELKLLKIESMETIKLFSSDRIANALWSNDSQYLFIEFDDAVGYLDVERPELPSYIAKLDRSRGDRFLGITESNAALVVRMNEQQYELVRVSPAGQEVVLLTTSDRIQEAIYDEQRETLFTTIHTSENKLIQQSLRGEREILKCSAIETCQLGAYDSRSSTLWIHSNHGVDLVSQFVWQSQESVLDLIHSDPQKMTDLSRALYLNGKPVIVQYHDNSTLYGIDSQFEIDRHLELVKSKLRGELITPQIGQGGNWLVKESGSQIRDPKYYLYNVEASSIQPIFSEFINSDKLATNMLSRKYFFQYPAQDGILINGYLTLPNGVDLSNAPMVVSPHGGPWGHVGFEYSPNIQLLANRGYIVFQPNFRASTGFGLTYTVSANRDFGSGVVQRDIIDGVYYLVENGIGSLDKLAISGSSFGGFSALSGLAFTPDLFRVGIAYLPPADFVHSINFLLSNPRTEISEPTIRARFTELVLEPGNLSDEERLFAQSPMASIEYIEAPLLVVAGADDDRVDIHHVTDYSLKLFNQGNELALIIDEDQGHDFISDESSAASMYLLEELLGLEFGTYREGLHDPALRRYIEKNTKLNTISDFLKLDSNPSF